MQLCSIGISFSSILTGIPSCPTCEVAQLWRDDPTTCTVTWAQPSTVPVTSTTVTYCPTSSPNCGIRVPCTSPCSIGGLDPYMEYLFTVTSNNSCGSSVGCRSNTVRLTTNLTGEPADYDSGIAQYRRCFCSACH